MSDESPRMGAGSKNTVIKVFSGVGFYLCIAAIMIACMHYGYSCSACGCSLVDSSVPR